MKNTFFVVFTFISCIGLLPIHSNCLEEKRKQNINSLVAESLIRLTLTKTRSYFRLHYTSQEIKELINIIPRLVMLTSSTQKISYFYLQAKYIPHTLKKQNLSIMSTCTSDRKKYDQTYIKI
jgi:hypothetical protein